MKTFKEYFEDSQLNEGYAGRVGDKVMDYLSWYGPKDASGAPEEDSLEIYKLSAKALGVSVNDLFRIDSEDEDSRVEVGFKAADKAFSKGTTENLKLSGSGVGGPFLSVNKKMGIVRYDEYGFVMFIFTNKSKF